MFSSSIQQRVLINCVIAYLLIPNILFLFGWVQWWFAVPSGVLLLLGWWRINRNLPVTERTHKWDYQNIIGVLFVLLLCFLIVESLGYTGRVEQSEDFRARNAMLDTIIRCDWPLRSADGGYFVYYHAFYLPVAILCRLSCGLISAEVGIYLWTLLGMFLAGALLISRYGGKTAAVFLLILCTLGFLMEWGCILLSINRQFCGATPDTPWFPSLPKLLPIPHYAGFWREIAIDAPHCGIAILLIFLVAVQKYVSFRHTFFIAALGILFSPYAAPGLLLFLLIRISPLLTKKTELIRLFTGISWCTVPLLLADIAFLTTNSTRPFNPFGGLVTPTGWNIVWLLYYLLALLSFLLPAYFILPVRYRRTSYFIAMMIMAVLLPFPGQTDGNFLIKGTALLALCQAWLYAHLLQNRSYQHKGLLCCFLILSSGYAILHSVKQCMTFTLDKEKQIQKNCKLSWHGHMNNPQDPAYLNFFSSGPLSPILYSEEGASARYLPYPFATGKKSSQDGQSENTPE